MLSTLATNFSPIPKKVSVHTHTPTQTHRVYSPSSPSSSSSSHLLGKPPPQILSWLWTPASFLSGPAILWLVLSDAGSAGIGLCSRRWEPDSGAISLSSTRGGPATPTHTAASLTYSYKPKSLHTHTHTRTHARTHIQRPAHMHTHTHCTISFSLCSSSVCLSGRILPRNFEKTRKGISGNETFGPTVDL